MAIKATPGQKREIVKYYVWHKLRLQLETLDAEEMDHVVRELLEKYKGNIWVEVVTTSTTTINYDEDKS